MARAKPLLLLAALLLASLPMAPEAEAATPPTYSLMPRTAAGHYATEYLLGEFVFLELFVRAGSDPLLVYRTLYITQLVPTPTTLVGTINAGDALQLAPGETTLVRVGWDQVPAGSGRVVDPGRYRIAYLDGAGAERASTVLDLGWAPDLRVTALNVTSAPLPPPASPTAPHLPQPVTKRITLCVENAGTESLARTEVDLHHRGPLEGGGEEHHIASVPLRLDSTTPACPAALGRGYLLQHDWVLPANAANRSLSASLVVATADPRALAVELDETNNGRTASFDVFNRCELESPLCEPPLPPLPPETPIVNVPALLEFTFGIVEALLDP